MRESIGATWIFAICLTFIILFTAYLAISVNYAKAFRIKSTIVTTIEENEGYTDGVGQQIENYLISQGYAANGVCEQTITVDDPRADGANGNTTDWTRRACLMQTGDGRCGACIYQLMSGDGNTKISFNDDFDYPRTYYKVVAFFKFDLPVVNYFTTFKVSGDTRYIYDSSRNNDN